MPCLLRQACFFRAADTRCCPPDAVPWRRRSTPANSTATIVSGDPPARAVAASEQRLPPETGEGQVICMRRPVAAAAGLAMGPGDIHMPILALSPIDVNRREHARSPGHARDSSNRHGTRALRQEEPPASLPGLAASVTLPGASWARRHGRLRPCFRPAPPSPAESLGPPEADRWRLRATLAGSIPASLSGA